MPSAPCKLCGRLPPGRHKGSSDAVLKRNEEIRGSKLTVAALAKQHGLTVKRIWQIRARY